MTPGAPAEDRGRPARRYSPALHLLAFGLLSAGLLAARAGLGTALGLDNAIEVYHAQSLALTYAADNPPLYTWMAWALEQALSPGLLPPLLLTHALLFAVFAVVLAIGRAIFADDRAAALAAWSLLLVPHFARGFATQTHSTLVMLTAALAVLALIRALQTGRLGAYAAMGLACGFGILAKYNFLLLPAVLAVAVLAVGDARRRVRPSGLALALASFAAIAGPYLTLVVTPGELVAMAAARTGEAAGGYFDRLAAGAASLASTLAASLWPMAIALAVAMAGHWRATRRAWPRGPQAWPARLILVAVAAGLGLLLAGLIFGPITRFSARYLHPLMLVVPLAAMALLGGRAAPRLVVRRYVVVLAVALATVVGLRLVELSPLCPQACRELAPYPALAERLRQAGFEGGTIIATESLIAGNLHVQFPGSLVVLSGAPYRPPPDEDGQCLVIWREAEGDWHAGRDAALRAAGLMPDDAAAARQAAVPFPMPMLDWSRPLAGFGPRSMSWRYLILDRSC
jgi:hypothetical protein